MIFETGDLYHIYNQGNNKQRIFFSRENYLYFLTKINQHILPHADVLAWCLMPNHFHLMVYVHTKEILIDEISFTSNSLTPSETITKSVWSLPVPDGPAPQLDELGDMGHDEI